MTSVDGAITPTADARVPVLDRGFLYGDSIYEVFRTYGGVPLFYDEHWQRFENSAALIRMRIGLSKDRAHGGDPRDDRRDRRAEARPGRVRALHRHARRGPCGSFPVAGAQDALRDHRAGRCRCGTPSSTRAACASAIASTRRNPSNALDPNIKGGNYLNNVLGVMDARALGADDCVMLNEAGLVTEASNSNVFFVIGGELVTPAQSAGNLRGLTKAALHDACRARGLATRERDIAADELPQATECFLTSATREVMPIVTLRTLDGGVLRFPEGGGALTRRAAAYYKEHVAEYLRTHAHLSLF